MSRNEVMVCVEDFERYAERTLPRNALDYYRSGADEEITLRDNVAAFKRYKILPRVLIDISARDLSTTILGHRITFPVCISPTAMHCMAHPEGEVATARAAHKAGIVYTLSTLSTTSLEGIAENIPDVLRFFQLYIYKDRDVTRKMVERAERLGYKALVLTVDTPFLGKRRADNRNKFKLPVPYKLAIFDDVDVKANAVNYAKSKSGLSEYTNSLFDPTLQWSDINWLREITTLPIVVKGILTAGILLFVDKDAVKAVEAGVNGIIVSNHGARQLDSVPATIDVLGEVVESVAGRCEVYMDGGVRTGTDVLKALALGAKAVFIGRPVLYSLSYNGTDGVVQMLEILKEEFSSAMAFSGCRNVKEVTGDLLRKATAADFDNHRSKL